jgi:sterol desaturase/sphingolipid hydroxylase (fatty acid hydroxylase superfamily)
MIFHGDHHKQIHQHPNKKWHWNNLLLVNDTIKSTIDLWITEVIPTSIISLIFSAPWLIISYYIWAAFLQESLEHNRTINLPPLSAGRWHLVHHKYPNKNFGFPFRIWDNIFDTHEAPDKNI